MGSTYSLLFKSKQEVDEVLNFLQMNDNTISNSKQPRDDEWLIKKDLSKFGESKTISAESYIEFCVQVYTMEYFLKSLNVDIKRTTAMKPMQFEYDYDKFTEIYLSQFLVMSYKDKVLCWSVDDDQLSITVKGEYSSELYDMLMSAIRTENPLKKKQIFITDRHGRLYYRMKKPLNIKLENVLMDSVMKEDIYDNVIFQLEELGGTNGVIFHGVPGTGKSATCSALINILIEKGYSACYITEEVDFDELEKFLNKMLAPCVLFIEDIDTMGQERTEVLSNIAPLLQFLNGLSEKSDSFVYVATTNHIKQLDKALSNRPCRFNRKFEFVLPTNSEIDILIDLYFKDTERIHDDNKKLCFGYKFTGSHIKELRRTCDMKVKKSGMSYNAVFQESVEIVKKNFPAGSDKIGF